MLNWPDNISFKLVRRSIHIDIPTLLCQILYSILSHPVPVFLFMVDKHFQEWMLHVYQGGLA